MIITIAIALAILVVGGCWRGAHRGRRWPRYYRIVAAETPRGIEELEHMLADYACRSGHPRRPSP
jgi:hypothetical protein